jgi:hypothetical protein
VPTYLMNMQNSAIDCNGNHLRVGMMVYTPDGWCGDKPRPWKSAVICGVSYVGGKFYLDLEGSIIHQCRDISVSIVNTYPPNAKAQPSGAKP